jgi:hypothetical protein
MYWWKDLDEMNPTILRKVTNDDQSKPHEQPKNK